jgi:hypothetical protein
LRSGLGEYQGRRKVRSREGIECQNFGDFASIGTEQTQRIDF